MLRPRKKYTVHDLQKLKGIRCLTHIHVKSPEEAAAAEGAGVDLISCSFDSTEAQLRLPHIIEAAPISFISVATPHGIASAEEAIRISFKALEMGASSVYCSASTSIIEKMCDEWLPKHLWLWAQCRITKEEHKSSNLERGTNIKISDKKKLYHYNIHLFLLPN